ncbi:MAG: protein phosphatase 2C domain-containing protein, partial [Clostridia bacterium]|nr:protein phosphatase 2C domain-containing protein [Clostridia bacterium]
MNRKWKISQYCENPPRFDLSRCQDACASYEDGELFVMALCDGAPAASLSHIGAACIAEFSAKYFAEHFDTLYDAEFNVACEELIKYHQAMISNLAEVAAEKKDVKILINRMIQLRELNKFSSTVQILAVKGENAIYFKVGNGSAVVASPKSVLTLSDSLVRDPVAYVTIPNPVNLLISCDFQRFTVSPSCYAIALATDGIEFDGGLFFNQKATHFYEKALEDIVACEDDVTTELQTLADLLLCDHKNTEKDNIGISVLHRECLPEPVVPLQEADEDVRIMIMEEPAGEEPKAQIVEESAKEEPKAEIVEESAKEEPKAEIVEEPVKEEPKVEIVEES